MTVGLPGVNYLRFLRMGRPCITALPFIGYPIRQAIIVYSSLQARGLMEVCTNHSPMTTAARGRLWHRTLPGQVSCLFVPSCPLMAGNDLLACQISVDLVNRKKNAPMYYPAVTLMMAEPPGRRGK